jgi:hypothetical protein
MQVSLMLIKCPACGASASLDVLVDDEPAAKALMAVAKLSPLGNAVIKYLGLFRPTKRQLSWSRVVTLLNEITPLIQQQRIERNHQVFEAPLHVWESAIEKVIQARDTGVLKTPLKSHGYLLEVVAGESAKAYVKGVQGIVDAPLVTLPQKPRSATAQALDALQNLK